MKTNNSFKKLMAELNLSAGKPEKGYKTTNELAKEWGLSREQAGAYIRKGLDAGVIEKKKFRVTLTARVCSVFHYKLLIK